MKETLTDRRTGWSGLERQARFATRRNQSDRYCVHTIQHIRNRVWRIRRWDG